MAISIFVSDSPISRAHGGGNIGYNLARSLHEASSLRHVFSTTDFEDNRYRDASAVCIDPSHWGYGFTPFFLDYLTCHLLPENDFDLCQFYGGPFGLTAKKLKEKNCTIITCWAPHDIELSQEEHMKLAGEFPFPHLTNPVLWNMYSEMTRASDVMITHSHKSAEYLQDKAKLTRKPEVVPHGCYPPAEIRPPPSKFTPGYFGTIGIDKGTIYLFEAWRTMSLSDSHKLLLGGGNTGQVTLPDSGKYKIIGRVEDKGDFYNNISVCILPSVTEGFGICALEAMSYGRPVIVTEGAGSHELITHGKDGFVVPIRNPDAIAGRIQYFYDNPSEVKRMGDNARHTAQKYTWGNIRERYKEIYRRNP